jgi:hypothetical protein
MLTIGLSHTSLILLRNISSIPRFLRPFTMRGCWIFVNGFFLHLLIWWYGFCTCFSLYAVLHLLIYIGWYILSSLESNWHGHGICCFQVVQFCLPRFCWEFFVSIFIKAMDF